MDSTGTMLLPPGSSTMSGEIDTLFYFLTYTSIIFLGIVTFVLIYFGIKYRRRDDNLDNLGTQTDHNRTLELTWSIIPAILVVIVFFWGLNLYMKLSVVPKDAVEINVTAQKWFWSFDYPEGNNSVGELIVPVGKPIKLLMSSKDVIHSFFVPDFRIKMDVLPNRYSLTWFEATSVGEHNLFCAEYCGDGHSDMIGKITVVSEEEYAKRLDLINSGEGLSLKEFGAKLFASRACVSCHSIVGKARIGPPLDGIFGKLSRFDDGTEKIVDENYVRQSILDPRANIVAGYDPVMPTFKGVLNTRQLDALLVYLKSLKGQQ